MTEAPIRCAILTESDCSFAGASAGRCGATDWVFISHNSNERGS
jgi:hypothetical protein